MVEIEITATQRRLLAISLWVIFTLAIAMLSPLLVAFDAVYHSKPQPELFRHGELFSSAFAVAVAAAGRCLGYLLDGEFLYPHFIYMMLAGAIALMSIWSIADIHDIARLADGPLFVSEIAIVASGAVGIMTELTRRGR